MINLLTVNRNAILIMDRDNYDSPQDEGDKAKAKQKKRVIKTCNSLGILPWMSKGIEMENYLPKSVGIWHQGQFTNKYKGNKVAESLRIAKELDISSLEISDLEEKIEKVVADIKKWNT